ncbi:hypothetical protein [Pseudomonas kuykendallii]|uniref:hypothetical protein n=1 Tax=Pseudomonas kuykendallii TaxID=1007099 RepID=UPI0028A14789|nr:hypothetical protein [Pseudomonas kuykendallii]
MQGLAVKNILHEELLLKIKSLAAKAESRFAKLIQFKGAKWEQNSWLYNGRSIIYLVDSESSNEELALLNKVYVVSYLWDRRAGKKQISAGRVSDLSFSLRILAAQGVTTILDINQDFYLKTFAHIKSAYKAPAGVCRALNIFVRFLFESGLSPQKFDIVGTADLGAKDKYGRTAIADKLPLPDMIKSIISLKWAIQDKLDESLRTKIDFLGILTQVFQYGLGLRIGEVLRLPKDCLIYIDGEMYCRVWTEKGTEPIARYIPTIWRSAITDAVDRINNICQPYRDRAASYEDGSFSMQFDGRFQTRKDSIALEVDTVLGRLHSMIDANTLAAKRRLRALKKIPKDELIELKRLNEYLPFASTAKDSNSLVKYYRANGFEVISQPIGKIKCAHYLRGADVKRRIRELVEFRRNKITYDELFESLHGRKPAISRSKDKFAFKDKIKFRLMTSLEAYALTGIAGAKRVVYLDRSDAFEVARLISGGGYDAAKYIPMLDAEQLYPEFFNQKTMTSIADSGAGFFSFLKVTDDRKHFYRPALASDDLNYRAAFGFLIEHESIKESALSSFIAINSKVSLELIEEIKAEFLAEGIEISSASFGINQKVSDFLFVVPASQGGQYNEHIPSIFGYHSVKHVIKPSRLESSAFIRYGVTADEALINSFQSHKGRHWQTNSLFRAGLAASIVNKWMGRTDSQGDYYDHQTPRERAEKVSELMLSEQSRFIGDVANKIKLLGDQNVPDEQLESYLDLMLKTVHYGPLGHCLRDVNLKPCEFHLKCLTGNSGKGCREFVVDLLDPVQVKKIEAERSRSENELSRLFEALNRPGVPVESVEMHIEHQMTIFRNSSYILDRSEVVLTQSQVEQSLDYRPFVKDGSVPSDCVFQCGGA